MALYFKFFAMHLKRRMAYRRSFIFSLVGQFLVAFTAFASILFLFKRFETVRGYSVGECMLTSGVVTMSFSLAECFFRGFDCFPNLVKSGGFDRVLLRPMNPMFLMLCENIEFARLGKLIQGVIMLIIGIGVSPVSWNFLQAMVLILMIIGGTAVFAGLFILYAGACFFTLEGLEFLNILTYGARQYGAYPLDVYGGGILKFCTCIIPYALFQYYPLCWLLGRTDNPLMALMPLMDFVFLVPCVLLWRLGMRRYTSAG